MNAIELSLPFPPSTNHYYRTVELPVGVGQRPCPTCKRRRTRAVTMISEDGRKYAEQVARLVYAKGATPLVGPLVVEIELFPPDRRERDVDNYQKPLLDSLKHRQAKPGKPRQVAWVFEDDSQIVTLITHKRMVVPGNGRAFVTVRQVEAVAEQRELPMPPPKPMNYPAGVVLAKKGANP